MGIEQVPHLGQVAVRSVQTLHEIVAADADEIRQQQPLGDLQRRRRGLHHHPHRDGRRQESLDFATPAPVLLRPGHEWQEQRQIEGLGDRPHRLEQRAQHCPDRLPSIEAHALEAERGERQVRREPGGPLVLREIRQPQHDPQGVGRQAQCGQRRCVEGGIGRKPAAGFEVFAAHQPDGLGPVGQGLFRARRAGNAGPQADRLAVGGQDRRPGPRRQENSFRSDRSGHTGLEQKAPVAVHRHLHPLLQARRLGRGQQEGPVCRPR
ncbi:hypothetical protein DFQ59_11726 [Thioalbus denitrificans]|uniref:Uncharacterized protein n=1 Tax=Thioalbus denitrificans TaxID=547122 RepID=A0A369BQJ5_9GAMM|nr:hypothetical protein DFQ59_11726 [Thioalbus denitrificans]